jgi:replicative DNA helicase
MNLDISAMIPPQAKDVEELVLGAIIIDSSPESQVSVFEELKPDDFYIEANRLIFTTLQSMFVRDEKIDLVTVVENLKKDGQLEKVGGPLVISKLTSRIASTANLDAHLKILRQKSIARKQIKFAYDLQRKAYDDTEDVFDNNDFMLLSVNQIINDIEIGSEKKIDEVLNTVEINIKSAFENQGITGIRTGYDELDQLHGGYKNGNLYIKAGRPAMGKTAEAICEAVYQAYTLGKKVAFFSLEMPTEQIVLRVIAVLTGISLNDFKTGKLSQDQWQEFKRAKQKIESGTLLFFDNKYRITEIIATSKKEKYLNGLDIMYIDYLQIVSGFNKEGNREQEISGISRALKMLSKSLDIPVIALSQLNRSVETRGGNKKPLLSDLRESGAIEQDADVVEFLYRPEYYGINEDEEGNSLVNIAFVLVAKNRHGAIKDVPLKFVKHLTRFENIQTEAKEIDNKIFNGYQNDNLDDIF